MNPIEGFTRRNFLRTGALGAAALAATGETTTARAAVTKPVRDPYDGLKMGITTYTLRKFPLDEAIEMIKLAGVKYVSIKDMHLPMKSTPDERREMHRKLEAAGLVLTGGGVISLKNSEADARAAFEYARDAGMPAITCAPTPDALDITEKMAKEFDIRVAIHNHGPSDKNFPSPLDVWKAVKDRDQRMGLCIDVGHTVRIGNDPAAIIKKCASRLYDFHMKDVSEAIPKGEPVEVGRGVIDIVSVLKALLEIKYPYNVALEYEANENAPMPQVIGSYTYMRGVLAALA